MLECVCEEGYQHHHKLDTWATCQAWATIWRPKGDVIVLDHQMDSTMLYQLTSSIFSLDMHRMLCYQHLNTAFWFVVVAGYSVA